MRKFLGSIVVSLIFIVTVVPALSQDTVCVASYNLLNYPGGSTSGRDQYFRAVVSWMHPDLLAVEEMTSQAGVNEFITSVMNANEPGTYATIQFHDGPDTDTEIFFKPSLWDFIDTVYVPTALRDIGDYTLQHKKSGEMFHVLAIHLKASSGTANEDKRLAEATILRNHLNAYPAGTNFVIVGDYNIYRSTEPAFQKLISSEANDNGRALDPLNMVGTWQDNPSFAQYFTQSTRTASFGGGATGGLDDRFDVMLISYSLQPKLVTGSYRAVGNDGNHLNSSLDILPNAAVPDSVALGVYNASDHLPIMARFVFQSVPLSIQLSAFTAVAAYNGNVELKWSTSSEINNYGFHVERSLKPQSDFADVSGLIPGHSTTNQPQQYIFVDTTTATGRYYRLRQIDLDGSVHFTESIEVSRTAGIPLERPGSFGFLGNYPNPFNPSTIIGFRIREYGMVTVKVFDLLGRDVTTLVHQTKGPGEYSVQFDGTGLSAGVYILRLQSGANSAVSKMVLLK